MNVREKGAALVEFALVAMLFFTVLFAIIEFGYLFWANLTMQHAVREAARFAVVTPKPLPSSTNPDPDAARCALVKDKIRDNSMGFYDREDPTKACSEPTFSTIDAAGNPSPAGPDCGSANQIIMIELTCNLPLMTPIMQPFFTNGKYTFKVGATMKNEAF